MPPPGTFLCHVLLHVEFGANVSAIFDANYCCWMGPRSFHGKCVITLTSADWRLRRGGWRRRRRDQRHPRVRRRRPVHIPLRVTNEQWLVTDWCDLLSQFTLSIHSFRPGWKWTLHGLFRNPGRNLMSEHVTYSKPNEKLDRVMSTPSQNEWADSMKDTSLLKEGNNNIMTFMVCSLH